MIRLLRAFALLRWRLSVNALRGRRRDKLEQVSRISRLLVLVIVTLAFLPTSLSLALLAGVGGWGMAQGNEKAAAVLIGARGVIALLSVLVVVTPILRFGGSASSMARLVLLPIPRALLWALEVAAQLVDPWMLAIIPSLIALPLGLAFGGDLGAAAIAGLASLAALSFLMALGSFAAMAGALLFRNRRIGELVAVGVLILFSVVAYIPMMARRTLVSGAHPRESVPVVDSTRYPWLAVTPWEQYALTVKAAASDEPSRAILPLAGLVATTGIFAGLSRFAFGRLIDTPAGRGARGRRGEARLARVPGLSPAASAVAATTLRLLLRSVRGRVMLFSSPLPILMIGLVWKKFSAISAVGAPGGVIMTLLGGFMGLVSMQAFLANQFAVDRAGLTLTFLTPASDRDIVIGKAAAGLAALSIPTTIAMIAGAVLQPAGSPPLWIAAALAVSGAYIFLAPVAGLLAALLPAPFDLMKLKGGNGHPLAVLGATFISIFSLFLTAGTGVVVYATTKSAFATLGVEIVLVVVALGIARLMFPAAARAVSLRRENIAMVAQGR
ncbi:MAG TPA: hypothetical protein VJ826_12095 [Candidatus Polarisedimenticolaceae bacterium]|nr:hypothetical protein [Candidatus Polarisedimenticolaceae bacterium]